MVRLHCSWEHWGKLLQQVHLSLLKVILTLKLLTLIFTTFMKLLKDIDINVLLLGVVLMHQPWSSDVRTSFNPRLLHLFLSRVLLQAWIVFQHDNKHDVNLLYFFHSILPMFITSSGGCALKYQTLLKPKLQCSLFPRRFFRVAQLNTRRYVSLFRRKSLRAISAYILEHGLIMDISAWSCTDVTVRTPQATSTDKNYISKNKNISEKYI